jgi:hypothetical protein
VANGVGRPTGLSQAHRPHNEFHLEHSATARSVEWTSRPDPDCADATGWPVHPLHSRSHAQGARCRLRPTAEAGRPDGRERRLHEADRSEFHSAIAAAHIRRQCMEFRGSWHHLTLRRCSGGAQRVDVSRETPNSGHNLRHRRDCRAENALPWPPASSDGNDGLIAPMHGRRSWQTSVRVSRHASNFSPARPRFGKCDAQWYFSPGATQAAPTATGPPPWAIHMRADHPTSAIATAAHHLPALRCASFDPHT